jgi:hypothetical protein
MVQEMFPEIETATEALMTRIRLTEAEISEMKEDLKAKKQLVRAWRKALAAFSTQPVPKKRTARAD